MLNLNLKNLEKVLIHKNSPNAQTQIKPNLGDNLSQIWDNATLDIAKVRDRIKSRNQGFIDLPYQDIEAILDFAKQVEGNYTNLVLIGIGGSSLGPKCLYQALGQNSKIPNIYILDNIDPDEIAKVDTKLEYKKTLFLVITKSGTTPETIATYLYFRERIQTSNLDPVKHFVFITDPKKGYLRTIANNEGITCFDIPENVGGRFSVLSNVGLVFAALVGIDVNKLLEGARDINDSFWDSNILDSVAWKLACLQYNLVESGQHIQVIMPYASALNSFGDWYVQLLSESIGKEVDYTGKIVNTGPTPLPAIGATDQHSQLQLFKEGPDDKVIIFLNVLNFESKLQIPEISDQNLNYLSNITFNDLIQAEFLATAQSLTESHKANFTIEIDQISAFTLGQLFQLFELSVASLGELYNIDTFNQPGVERGKILTKELLLKNKTL